MFGRGSAASLRDIDQRLAELRADRENTQRTLEIALSDVVAALNSELAAHDRVDKARAELRELNDSIDKLLEQRLNYVPHQRRGT